MNVKIILFFLASAIMSKCSTTNQEQEEKPLGSDVRIFENTPVWEVAQAIQAEDTFKIKQLLKGKPDSILNYQEKYYGQSLLEWAVYTNHYPSAKVLAEMGVNPNLKSYDSTSAFIHAADKRATSNYLRLLLKYGGDVNAVADIEEPQHLRTPLMAAAFKNLENVRLLIEAGADPDYIHVLNGNTQSALMYAFFSDDIDIVNYLVMDAGVDFKRALSTTIKGDSLYITHYLRDLPYPLESEEYKKKMKLVEFLKERGMDYREAPVPKHYYKIYDSTYLEKY